MVESLYRSFGVWLFLVMWGVMTGVLIYIYWDDIRDWVCFWEVSA